MTEEELAIPLPTRPGTTWEPEDPSMRRCTHCRKEYRSHGAPEEVAKAFNIDLGRRHLICPASDKAWDEYNWKRRVISFESTRREVVRALEALHGHDATIPLDKILPLLPDRPKE